MNDARHARNIDYIHNDASILLPLLITHAPRPRRLIRPRTYICKVVGNATYTTGVPWSI